MSENRLRKEAMPLRDIVERLRGQDEVALGFTPEMAKREAERCLQCAHSPCRSGCPVQINIPGFLQKIADDDMAGAFAILSQQTNLPAVCGRVCPQETLCEHNCVLNTAQAPIGIGYLERFVADWQREHNEAVQEVPSSNGHRVAVVGSGPAGLTVAGDLAKLGYQITVYEALHQPGGVLIYGIPEFRLPKAIVAHEIENLRHLGVQLETNIVIGKTLSVDDLFAMGFEAVFLGSGAGLPRFMNIPGENLNGVYSANEYLTRINLMRAAATNSRTPILRARRVAIVGGGNVAMDAARAALRLGAEEVHIVYRRGRDEMPARLEEIHHAEEEGIIFTTLTQPIRVIGNENHTVCGLECLRCELGEPDSSGRRRPVEIAGSEFILEIDCVIIAVGTSPNPLLLATTSGLEGNRWGGIVTQSAEGLTSRAAVYAGGDAVNGAGTVISAMADGKAAAKAIDTYLKGVSL